MATNLFVELASEKQERIISVGISEFAKYGYSNSSTNRIVKNSGISKGSLFQYFQSKEELYFYILDCIISEFMTSLNDKVDNLSTDPVQRVIGYSELEFAWYIQNPEKYEIMVSAFAKNDGEIYKKVEARYSLVGEDTYYKLMGVIDPQKFKRDKKKAIDVLMWFLKGFNEDFVGRADVRSHNNIDALKSEYVKCLTEYMEMLKEGLFS